MSFDTSNYPKSLEVQACLMTMDHDHAYMSGRLDAVMSFFVPGSEADEALAWTYYEYGLDAFFCGRNVVSCLFE